MAGRSQIRGFWGAAALTLVLGVAVQAQERKGRTAQTENQNSIVGLEVVRESLNVEDVPGRQVLSTRMADRSGEHWFYFVKMEADTEYEPNITTNMLGKNFGPEVSATATKDYAQKGGELDLFSSEALAKEHDSVSIQVLSDSVLLISLWQGNDIVGVYVSASQEEQEKAVLSTSLSAEQQNVGEPEPIDPQALMQRPQKRLIACDLLWAICTNANHGQQVAACNAWLTHCQGT